MKKFWLYMALSLMAVNAFSQYETDIMRYTNLMPYGTARFSAMGGAFGALGGDLTTMSYNPAGTGIYRRSDVAMTTSWSSANSEASYNGTTTALSSMNIHLGNIGFLIANPQPENSDWKYINAGISYNQLANFNRDIRIKGFNDQNSILDAEVDALRSGNSYEESNLFYLADVIFYDTTDATYYNDYQYYGAYGADVKSVIRESGSIGEWDFNVSANYKDAFYIGATLGLVRVDYQQTTTYTESPTAMVDGTYHMSSLEAIDYYRTQGTGVNIKIGAMGKVGQLLRLGAAFHSPTIFALRDNYYSTVNSTLIDSDYIYENSATTGTGVYNWEASSPMKLMGSAALVLGRFATLSAEAEYLNYTNMNIRINDDYDFSYENDLIQSIYRQNAINIRSGAEIRLGILSFRGGMAFYQSPYTNDEENSKAHTWQMSGGIGLKTGGVYFDAAYVYRTQNQYYYLYDADNTESELKLSKGSFMASIGYRF